MATEWKRVLDDGTELIRTCAWSPPGCHPVGCGLILHVKDGKLVKVEGDPDHPVTKGRLCPRCLCLEEAVYHPKRILHPMKRDPKNRGRDEWEPITWDEAYDLIEEKVHYFTDTYGPESMVVFTGTGRETCMFTSLLGADALGTPNMCYTQSGFSCYGPRQAVTTFLTGAQMLEIDYAGGLEGTYENPEYQIPAYILLWGKAPLASNPDGFFGHSIIDLMKRGAKIICVDPRMHWLATKAEHVLQLRPGTDTALAMAILNYIIQNDLYDHAFVDNYTYGFEELAERVSPCTTAWAAETCDLDEQDIVTVAREISTKHPVALGMGVAVDQNRNGVQLIQCLMAITSITGNLDVPGGTSLGVMVEDTVVDTYFPNPLSDELTAKRVGSKEYPAINAALSRCAPDYFLYQMESDTPYPLKMGWFCGNNLLSPTNSAQPRRWHEALSKLEFVVTQDFFMNPTAMALSDLFLPVASTVEHEGTIITNYGLNASYYGATSKCVEVGDCKSDIEIIFDLTARLHPGVMPWNTPREYFDSSLVGLGLDLEGLQHEVVHQTPPVYRKYEKGLLRFDGQPGFNTVTGKLELYSTVYENFGDDPLPYYLEPPMSPVSTPEMCKEYPLILTTGARHFTSFHSEHRQIETLRAIDKYPECEINPETAEELGIVDGDWIEIENPYGKCREVAKVTPIVKKNVVAAAHGWWYPEDDPEEPNLFGTWKSNCNSLIPHGQIGKMGFGANYKSVLCKVTKSEKPL